MFEKGIILSIRPAECFRCRAPQSGAVTLSCLALRPTGCSAVGLRNQA